MKEFWSLHSRQSHSRHDSGVTYHDTYVRAIEMASRLWRQGRQASQIIGPNGERIPRAEVEAAVETLYKIEARCEECYRGECNSLHRVIEKHGLLPWNEFVEAAMTECSHVSQA